MREIALLEASLRTLRRLTISFTKYVPFEVVAELMDAGAKAQIGVERVRKRRRRRRRVLKCARSAEPHVCVALCPGAPPPTTHTRARRKACARTCARVCARARAHTHARTHTRTHARRHPHT